MGGIAVAVAVAVEVEVDVEADVDVDMDGSVTRGEGWVGWSVGTWKRGSVVREAGIRLSFGVGPGIIIFFRLRCCCWPSVLRGEVRGARWERRRKCY